MKILKLKLLPGAQPPERKSNGAAGYDLYANIDHVITILPGSWTLVPCGFIIELEPGYEAQVRSRSGLAVKNGIVSLLGPGTIDWDYRGEIHIPLLNVSQRDFLVEPQMRVGQMVINQVVTPEIEIVKELTETERGAGGFGSSGIK